MHDVSPKRASFATEPLLRAIGITKRYGAFPANDGIDLDLFPAEIHALLGENGAGKSTLVKVMYGLIQPSEGQLQWMGDKVILAGPSRGARSALAWCSSTFPCSKISRLPKTSRWVWRRPSHLPRFPSGW